MLALSLMFSRPSHVDLFVYLYLKKKKKKIKYRPIFVVVVVLDGDSGIYLPLKISFRPTDDILGDTADSRDCTTA